MSVEIILDTDATLSQRISLCERKLVLYTALEDAPKKAEWLAIYKALSSLTDSSTVMDISLPDE